MRELEGQDVLVLGLGISGRSAARFCAEQGARVVACDERPRGDLAGGVRVEGRERPGDPGKIGGPGALEALEERAEIVTGRPFPDPAEFDLVVPSPGVPRERYVRRARCVWGDVELAGRALAAPIVAVTGTNGKSTTALLLASMLRAAGLRAEAAGNIGVPCLDLVGRPLDAAVLEVSSFQLETTERFRPAVAVVLNVTPDHLDRHGSFEAYAAAKARIFERQEGGDACVLNADDPVARSLAARIERAAPTAEGVASSAQAPAGASQYMGTRAGGPAVAAQERSGLASTPLEPASAGQAGGAREPRLRDRPRVLLFSRQRPVEEGCFFDTGSVVWRDAGRTLRIPLDDMRLRGPHNLENALAAAAAVGALGADPEKAAAALCDFAGLPHRGELVRRLGRVDYVNDSKATNPGAARAAIEGAGRPVVWLAGGRDKGLDAGELAAAAAGRVRAALLFGEAAPRLAAALEGRVTVHRHETLAGAVAGAAALAAPGDVVLLAPACASQDQFRSFEERGERFRAAVAALPDAPAGAETAR